MVHLLDRNPVCKAKGQQAVAGGIVLAHEFFRVSRKRNSLRQVALENRLARTHVVFHPARLGNLVDRTFAQNLAIHNHRDLVANAFHVAQQVA